MKKNLIKKIALCVALVLIFGIFCSCNSDNKSGKKVQTEKKYNVAVISGAADDEDFSSFFQSVSDTFKNIGYRTDKFSANGNTAYLNDILNSSLEGGYMGVILYDLNDYADEFVLKANEAGVFSLVFTSSIYENENAKIVAYDQKQMAIDSVDALVEYAKSKGDSKPKIIKVWHDRTGLATSTKSTTFDEYVKEEKINVVSEICEETLRVEDGLSRAVKAAISDLPDDEFNYLWVCDDAMAKLVIEVLKSEGIHNAVVVSASMSPSGLEAMHELSEYWYASSVVGFKTSGQMCAEALSACVENKEVPNITSISTTVIYGSDIAGLDKNTLADALGI